MQPKEIARTILGQIMFSDKKALDAWEAKNFVALTEKKTENGLQLGGIAFDVKKGKVVVRLMGNDTYRVEAVDQIRPCIYCDELEPTIGEILHAEARA